MSIDLVHRHEHKMACHGCANRDRECILQNGNLYSVSAVVGMLFYIGSIFNSYPRTQHAEPDAQVTLRALHLLHNALAQLQGRVRRNGWFSDWISQK